MVHTYILTAPQQNFRGCTLNNQIEGYKIHTHDLMKNINDCNHRDIYLCYDIPPYRPTFKNISSYAEPDSKLKTIC